jgi:hypothetical protein
MKNVTISLDDGLYERSRVVAAQRKSTVTGLVREFLQRLADVDEKREQARREIQAMAGSFGGRVGRLPSREERNARR